MTRSVVFRTVAALFLLAPLARAQSPMAGSTTVILVRHAEKAAEPAADPPLTAAGAARANALAELVKDAGIKAIFSTQFVRTRSTAQPIATRLGLPVQIVDARAPGHARLVADSILKTHRGQTVLVVGHSNTVPEIVAALGAPQPAPICDDGYDSIFIVTVPTAGAPTVVRLHFGAAAACPG